MKNQKKTLKRKPLPQKSVSIVPNDESDQNESEDVEVKTLNNIYFNIL